MKRHAIKWIIAASAIIFLIGGTAWADGKGSRGHHNNGKGYHSSSHHGGGHGPANYKKPLPLGKYRDDRHHRKPHYGNHRPNHGHYRPHRRPHHGHANHGHHQYYGGKRVHAVKVKSKNIHNAMAKSLLTGNPLFALDALVNR
jgi:hypothetical protein